MSSNNFRSDSSAFIPFQRKKSVGVSEKLPDIEKQFDQAQMSEAIKSARQNRKMMFSNIRKLFKENVSRVIPCLKENES
jgi:hypothetical protein